MTALATCGIVATALILVVLRERRLRRRQQAWLYVWGERSWGDVIAREAQEWLERETARDVGTH